MLCNCWVEYCLYINEPIVMTIAYGLDKKFHLSFNSSHAMQHNLKEAFTVDEALKFLHVMRSLNCFPDQNFYSSVIHTLSLHNKANEADMIFETMLQCGHLPSTLAYNLMISSYCYAGKN